MSAPLHWEATGAGAPLVLVHAGVCDGRMWDCQWAALAGSFRMVRCDLRGFGRSPFGPEPYSHARELLGVMDAAGLERATLVGNSLGGRVVLEVAVAAPERVAGLVLVAPGLPGRVWSQALRAFAEAEEAAYARGDLDAAAELNVRTWLVGPRRRAEDVDSALRERVHAMQLRALELAVAAGEEPAEELLVPDVGSRLGEIGARTLVAVGELDQPDFRAIAEEVATAIPGARRVEIAGAAHLPSLEQPAAFDRLLLGFLAR